MLRNILIIVYLVIGVFVASSHHYFEHLNSLTGRALGAARGGALAADLVRRQPAHQVGEDPMHTTLVASLLASVSSAGGPSPSFG